MKDPFERSREKEQEERITLIKNRLKILKGDDEKFEFITHLADDVSRYITKHQRSVCSRTTLLRNSRYKELLVQHMLVSSSRSVDPGARKVSTQHDIGLIERDLTISNLRREIARLQAHISALESERNSRAGNAGISVTATDKRSSVDLSGEFRDHFVRTCQSLRLLIDYLRNQFVIDADLCLLRDATMKRGNNIVVNAENLKPFIDWLSHDPRH